jgi:hypothetical protein
MDGLLGVAGMITSDYGSFPHSLLRTSKFKKHGDVYFLVFFLRFYGNLRRVDEKKRVMIPIKSLWMVIATFRILH